MTYHEKNLDIYYSIRQNKKQISKIYGRFILRFAKQRVNVYQNISHNGDKRKRDVVV